MRSDVQYPVDRYLVECSKKFEMVNIIDDGTWNVDPALKPEDELILRKLHEMLQSTADDLKLLSGELSKHHEPGVQVKSAPTPLDEEFNEKVHIEEIVNAKFHGYKIIEKPTNISDPSKLYTEKRDNVKTPVNSRPPKVNNANVQVNTAPINKKPAITRKLSICNTKGIDIKGDQPSTKTEKLNNGKIIKSPAVKYNEFTYKYEEPKYKSPQKVLQVQEMPGIHIRSELKQQKVVDINIMPENYGPEKDNSEQNQNVAVVVVQHEMPKPTILKQDLQLTPQVPLLQAEAGKSPKPIRKISKLSTCESSESNHQTTSSDTQIKLKLQKSILTTRRTSPKNSSRNDRKNVNAVKKTEKRMQSNIDGWRKKLSTVYGSSSLNKNTTSKNKTKTSPKKSNIKRDISNRSHLNNMEYIPYSKLTVGGVRASDIEKEIFDIPNKNDIPLSPILDKILSSRENSCKNSPRKHKSRVKKILTTSDENLLQEVMDIERTVSETLSKNQKFTDKEPDLKSISTDTDDTKGNESYADDFEDDKSGCSDHAQNNKQISKSNSEDEKYSPNDTKSDNTEDIDPDPNKSNTNDHNLTYNKTQNLSFKNQVDVFEFVHSVDTQDCAIQSQITSKISLKETQTSPRNDTNIQPIHNDLWPALDPKGEIEKMFQQEKDFIKHLIAQEYGDLIEQNIAKPSTSKDVEQLNVASIQKNTQTSPARVKYAMTSPTRTKTRTTSPLVHLTTDHNTSPMIFITNENDIKIDIQDEEDLATSINLSSPRFSLRLPRNSKEVLCNLDSASRTEKKSETRVDTKKNSIRTLSTSSMEADSSDISSLGEVKLRRKFAKVKTRASDSESVCSLSSSSSKSSSEFQSGILPLRSEGEMSLGRKKNSKSEGEASFGQQ